MVLSLGIDEQKDIFLEACVETLEEAILAEKRGANRLEICSRLDLDGLTQINIFKSIGVMEVVLGALNINNEIDIKVTNRLAKYAFPMKVTFHKAIDQTSNILSAIENIKSIPEVSSVLTSGGKSKAESGYKIIEKMIKVSENNITIIAAGSITNENLEYLHKKIGAMEYHGRKIVGRLD